VASWVGRPCPEGSPRSDPDYESSRSTVGCSQDSRRVVETWYRDLRANRRQVYGSVPQAAVADMANLPRKTFRTWCRLISLSYRRSAFRSCTCSWCWHMIDVASLCVVKTRSEAAEPSSHATTYRFLGWSKLRDVGGGQVSSSGRALESAVTLARRLRGSLLTNCISSKVLADGPEIETPPNG
jgi:hypothetical protein